MTSQPARPAGEALPVEDDFATRGRPYMRSGRYPLEVHPEPGETGLALAVLGSDTQGAFSWRTGVGLPAPETVRERFDVRVASRRVAWVTRCVEEARSQSTCSLLRLRPRQAPEPATGLPHANLVDAMADGSRVHVLLRGQHDHLFAHWTVSGLAAHHQRDFVALGRPVFARVDGRVVVQPRGPERDEFWTTSVGAPFERHPAHGSLPVCRSARGATNEFVAWGETTRVWVGQQAGAACIAAVAHEWRDGEILLVADSDGVLRSVSSPLPAPAMTCTRAGN